jgi:hypothetical protein
VRFGLGAGGEGRVALFADQFAAEHAQVIGRFAEHAAPFELAQQHPVTLNGHVEKVALSDTKNLAELGGNDHPAEVIDLAGDALSAFVGKRFIGGTCHAPNVEGSDTLCRTSLFFDLFF